MTDAPDHATDGQANASQAGRLRIVRGSSIEVLAAGLARQLAAHPPSDPMAAIEVAVPSRGMERWLVQRLATDLGAIDGEAGICANIHFPFPGSVVQRVVGAVLGDPAVSGADATVDPWSPQRLAWPLLELLDGLSIDPDTDDKTNEPLLAHLSESGERAERRRFPLARRVADLFDRYAMYRPEMVEGWTAGGNAGPDGQALPANAAWQPPLWRALIDRLGTPSPDARFRAAISALDDGRIALPHALPARVTIFGVLALPPAHLDVLAALARRSDVTIHALTPIDAWVPSAPPPPRPPNPLLAANGMAAAHAHQAFSRHEAEPDESPHLPHLPESLPTSALALLQADIRADRRRGPRDEDPQPLAAEDRSLQVHACHGPMRQLEVLREVLLGLLQDDPTLEPRHIVVLAPDIEAYDPFISAVFSDGDRPWERQARGLSQAGAGVPALPYRVADRTVRDENPVAQALLGVLALVTLRVGASAVVDLLGSPPVSARFGLSAAEIAKLPTWLMGTGTTWGMDAAHREQLIGLDDASHTWAAGLDRLALGAAMADDGHRMVEGVVPFDDVEGAGVDLAGRLAEATQALFGRLRALAGRRDISAWRSALEETIDVLLDPCAGPQRDADLTWQLSAVREALATMAADSAGPDGEPSGVELTLEEVRAVLGSQLGQRGGAAQYGSGAITFSGLIPLRNVPHRVVCLVGLDDGALPRSSRTHGFDLLAAQPRAGDPDPRIEDRQLLLDALLAARDTVVITYTGSDPRTNEAQQPAVPVSELLDVAVDSLVDGTAEDGSGDVRARLVTAHPLQPHSARYFRDARDDETPVPRAFDNRQLVAARAAVGDRQDALPFFPRPLPPPGPEELDPQIIELPDLIRFLEHPIRQLLQRRVGITLGSDNRRLEDRDPTELDALEKWKLQDDLLTRRLAKTASSRWHELTLACGNVPVGGLGEVALDGVEVIVDQLCEAVDGITEPRTSRSIDVRVTLPGTDGAAGASRRIVGTIDLHGSTLLAVTVSKLKHKRWLAPWVRLLAATADAPELEPTALLLGAKDSREIDRRTLCSIAALLGHGGGNSAKDARDPAQVAADHLGVLVGAYLRGHSEPLPLPTSTAACYAAARVKGKPHKAALTAAQGEWETGDHFGAFPKEQDDPYHVQAFGSGLTLRDLDRTTDFADLAQRIWTPILHSEATS